VKIKLTNHAKKRMWERNVSISQIRKAFKKPFATLPTKDGRRKRIMADIDKKILDIIYVPQRKDVLIVTVAWLTKEDRKVCP
jgi:hypothetical protein